MTQQELIDLFTAHDEDALKAEEFMPRDNDYPATKWETFLFLSIIAFSLLAWAFTVYAVAYLIWSLMK